jgi:hypothetical protein
MNCKKIGSASLNFSATYGPLLRKTPIFTAEDAEVAEKNSSE